MQNKQVTVSVVKAKFFKDTAHFSVRQMLIFGLVAAALGVYFIWHSFAAAPVVTSLEAEQMTTLPPGSIVQDTTASGGYGVLFTDKTLASHTVTLASQATSMSIRAKGVVCGTAPVVSIKRVDNGVTLATITANSSSWADSAPVAIDLAGGAYNISVQFTNPNVQTVGNSGKERCRSKVSVDKLVFYGPDTAANTISLNDNTVGTSTNQFQYAGSWIANTDSPAFMSDQHYTNVAGSTYQLTFSGTQLKMYSTTAPHHGIAAVSIDGGAEQMVDFYSTTRTNQVLVYSSPILSSGSHIVKVRATGTKNPGSSDTYIVADRLDISTDSNTTSAPVLPLVSMISPTDGATVDGQVNVQAMASASNGVKKVEFYLDNSTTPTKTETAAPYCLAGDDPANLAACATWNSTSIANGLHSFTAYSYDANDVKSLPSTVKFNVNNTTNTTSTTPTSSTCVNPSPATTRLRASGRNIVDEAGNVVCKLKGFNMHVGPGFTWDQTHFDAIKALGGNINRAVIHWDQFEPNQGQINTTAINNLDLHIARAQAAGSYTMLELHLNVGRMPGWTGTGPEVERYSKYGQTITQYLANRYGNPASAKYTKAVIGFGLNEPPLEDNNIRNGTDSIPYLEGKQRQMISWMRGTGGNAASWIGFVAYGYASATPTYTTWSTSGNTSAKPASPTAYDSVGGNVIIDVHDYMTGCTNTVTNCDGRQTNGMIWPTGQGGSMLSVGSYTSSALYKSQKAAFWEPYKNFSINASIPLMLGEWGWPNGDGSQLPYIIDQKPIWNDAGTKIEIWWNYDINASNSEWAARPGGTWRSSVTEWMK